MHFLDEILAEGNKEQDAQNAAQQAGKEHFEEVDSHLGILGLQDVERRKREDGSCHNDSAAGANALDDDVLAHGVLAVSGSAHAHSDDGDGNGCLKHLTYLQSQVGSSGTEEHCHQNTPPH